MIELLCRLTWNENRWQTPSGHKWSKNGKSYEQLHGYGHEEWLFNAAFNLNGMQYGFIQGIGGYHETDRIDELHFFTIQDHTRTRFYLGSLKNVNVVHQDHASNRAIWRMVDSLLPQMEDELKEVGADYRELQTFGFFPNISFSLDDAQLLDEPKPIISKEFCDRFFRFKPFRFTAELAGMVISGPGKDRFDFEPSPPGAKVLSYQRSVLASKRATIDKLHNAIERDLYHFLTANHGVSEGDISCGKTYVGDNIVDIAVKSNDNIYSLFEIKTSLSSRQNIRTALAQLLDYTFWTTQKIDRIVIVAPSGLDLNSKAFLVRIKKAINIAIEYWQHIPTKKNSKGTFVITK